MTGLSSVRELRRRRYLQWEIAAEPPGHDGPPTWVPAHVPGTAQQDWLAAQGHPVDVFDNQMPSYFRELEGYRWRYRARLEGPDLPAYLVLRGVDFEYSVSVNGQVVLNTRGMYVEHSVLLPSDARLIEIVIEPPPVDTEPPIPGPLWEWTRDRRGQARRATRPLVSYGDDYQPRVLTAGPWQEIYLERRPSPHLADHSVQAVLSPDLTVGQVKITADIAGDVRVGAVLRLVLTPCLPAAAEDAPRPTPLVQVLDLNVREHTVTVQNPMLWWPWELGAQWLYRVEIELVADSAVVDRVADQVAFRHVELVVYQGGWQEADPEGYPKSRVEPPHTLKINGRPLFLKGTCMVPPSLFPHEGNRERYDPLVAIIRSINFNLIKNSGGGIVHRDEFYLACDEAGVMVWQDFPLSCNQYPEDETYLDLLSAEAISIVRRLRRHPSVVVWCGGNELFTPWSRMTEQHPALRLLNMITFQHDPHTPFVGSTPQQGASHGYYMFVNPDRPAADGLSYLYEARSTAYMEVACPAPASAERLRRLIPEPALFPPVEDPAWRLRSAWDAWDGRPDTWLCWQLVRQVAGECVDLEEFVAFAQLMQACVLQQAVEEARRQQPRCSAICIWALNEPWPNAANLSITSYPAEPKPAVGRIAAAARASLLSLRVPKLRWRAGESIDGEVWLLDDCPEPRRETFSWRVELRDGAGRILASDPGSGRLSGDAVPARQLGGFRLTVPGAGNGDRRVFSLDVRSEQAPELDSNYTLFIPPTAEVS